MWQWIKNKWMPIECWIHSWFPGMKTRIMTGLGAISQGAAFGYQYITGLPTTKWINQEALQAAALIMFSLSFWFSNMGKRVETFESSKTNG